MAHTLSDVYDEGWSLQAVIGYYFVDTEDPEQLGPPMLVALGLDFGEAQVAVYVNDADDTMHHKPLGEFDVAGLVAEDLGQDELWAAAIGKPILWYWQLENQQGYVDALQLEFAQTTADKSVTLQLVAIASQVWLRVVSDART